MRITAIVASVLILAIMAVPVAAQTRDDAVPVWAQVLDLNSGGCGVGNAWRGVVKAGLIPGTNRDDSYFPNDLEYFGGICYNIGTGEVRAWSSGTQRGGIRIFKIPRTNLSESEFKAYCESVPELVRQGAPRSVEVNDVAYSYYIGQFGAPATFEDRFLSSSLIIVGIARRDCLWRADTSFRAYSPFAPIPERFDSPLMSGLSEIVYDDSLSDDGGFDEGFLGYILWMLLITALPVGIYFGTKSVMWSASIPSVLSLPLIYITDVPNYALIFPAGWLLVIGVTSFYRR